MVSGVATATVRASLETAEWARKLVPGRRPAFRSMVLRSALLVRPAGSGSGEAE